MTRDEQEHYDELLGYPKDYSPSERAYDIKKAAETVKKMKIKYIGEDKAQVTIVKERWQDRDHGPDGDNMANDGENKQGWDEWEPLEEETQ